MGKITDWLSIIIGTAAIFSGAFLGLMMVIEAWMTALEPVTIAPAASAAPKPVKSDVVDNTRTDDLYVKYRKETDAWRDDRDGAAKRCAELNGAPVFTYGLRVICVAKSAIIFGGSGGEPERPAPELP